jgi:hypothetical protein
LIFHLHPIKHNFKRICLMGFQTLMSLKYYTQIP